MRSTTPVFFLQGRLHQNDMLSAITAKKLQLLARFFKSGLQHINFNAAWADRTALI